MKRHLDGELRKAMMLHIQFQLQSARESYRLARQHMSHAKRRWDGAKKWLTKDSTELVLAEAANSRALRLVNYARRRYMEAIRFAEKELGRPHRKFGRRKRRQQVKAITGLEAIEVLAA